MTMVKTRKKHERNRWDDLPDTIDFKGLTQEEVPARVVCSSSLPGGYSKKF
jgi:hypothetical protein